MQAKYLPQEDGYHQLSQLILLENSPNPDIPVSAEIAEMMLWVCSEATRPLLITSEQFGGKKVLISEFIRHLNEKNKELGKKNKKKIKKEDCSFTINSNTQYIAITQFASLTPYYSDILYKIMSKLRVYLNITQKVQLNQEKLRQYFRYWLEIADQKIQREFISYREQEKPKIVITIEGIDKVADSKHHYVSPSFWLPEIELRNIKLILTAATSDFLSDSIVSRKIEHMLPPQNKKKIKDKIFEQYNILSTVLPKQTNFSDLKIARSIIQSNSNFINFLSEKGEKLKNFDQYFFTFLDFVGGQNIEIMNNILACLIWSRKGLKKQIIRRALKISQDSLTNYFNNFKAFLLEHKDFFIIINERIKKLIQKYFDEKNKVNNEEKKKKQKNKDTQFKKQIHSMIAKSLKKQSITVSILEESIHHLRGCNDFTELKQILSRIQHFLVLYTPLTKHLLCVCWLHLQHKFQYDPVFEYNKAIERFLNHYYPSPQDTFKIIFQLSLFFKEYSEFENPKTPEFRHPPVRGQMEQMKEISIFEELQRMQMFSRCKQKINQDKKSPKQNNSSLMKKSANKFSTTTPTEITQNVSNADISTFEQTSKQNKEVEYLNVKIKFHQQKFREYYMKDMEAYINEYYTVKKKYLGRQKQNLLDGDSDDEGNDIDENRIEQQKQKIKKEMLLKNFSDYCEEVYHKKSVKRSFYYYKQWIWMQFPWICQSIKNDYSQLIQQCMHSPTQYMSIEKQSKLIEEALKIATIAKENKDQIYQNSFSMNINLSEAVQARMKKDKQEKTMRHQRISTVGKNRYTERGNKHKIDDSKQKNNERNIKGRSIAMKRVKKYEIQNSSRMDASRLDEQIAKNTFALSRQKGKSFTRNSSSFNRPETFVTDMDITKSMMQQKQNQVPMNQKLPTISKVSSTVASRMKCKKNQIVNQKQMNSLLGKVDQMKFENKKLLNKIEELKKNNSHLNTQQGKKQNILTEITQLKHKTEDKLKNYQTQRALKHKLETIIKLCDVNKSHGSESQHLNNFLNSLKYMFRLQCENITKIQQDMRQQIQKFKSSYKQSKQQKSAIEQKVKKQKQRLKNKNKKNTEAADPVKLKVNQSFVRAGTTSRGKKKTMKKTTNKKIQKQSQEILKLQNFLKNVFNLKYQSETNDNIFKTFDEIQSKVSKKTQMEWKVHELKNQNNDKQKQLNTLKQEIDVLGNYEFYEKEQKKREDEEEINEKIKRFSERKKCLLKGLSMLKENQVKNC